MNDQGLATDLMAHANPQLNESSLSSQEVAVLAALRARPDKVHSRTELARAAGLSASRGRRVDALLVGVRHALANEVLLNVRNRGWRLVPQHHDHPGVMNHPGVHDVHGSLLPFERAGAEAGS